MRYRQKAILLFTAAATPLWPPAFVPNAAPPNTPPAATFEYSAPSASAPGIAPNATFKPEIPTPHPVPTPCTEGICPVPTFTISPLPCDFFPSLVCPKPTDGVYLVLGDSLALGLYGVPSYANIVEDHIEKTAGIGLDSHNLARAGWHSSHLAAALEHDPIFRQQVATADVIIWNIGGNDLRAARDHFHNGSCGGDDNQQCLRRAVTAFRNNWDVIVHQLNALKKRDSVIIRSMDLYNPFVKEDMARGTYITLNGYLNQINSHIHATHSEGIRIAGASKAFNGPSGLIDPADTGLISFDGYHPNPAGHRVLANAFIQTAIIPPIEPRPTPTWHPTPTPLPTPTRPPIPIPFPDPKCLAPCIIDASGNITCICAG